MASAVAKGIKMVPQVSGVTLNLSTGEAQILRNMLFFRLDDSQYETLRPVYEALCEVFNKVQE